MTDTRDSEGDTARSALRLVLFLDRPPSPVRSFLGDLDTTSKSSSLLTRFLLAGLGSGADALRSEPAFGLRLLPDSKELTGMKERGATWGYVVLLANMDASNSGKSSTRVRRWLEWDLRLSAAWDATRILSSPPNLSLAASSAISARNHMRSSFSRRPRSIIWMRT